jgi:hypothetical protein
MIIMIGMINMIIHITLKVERSDEFKFSLKNLHPLKSTLQRDF